MKKILLLIFLFRFSYSFGQGGEWVWLRGDSTTNQPGNFGTRGVSNPTNEPPSLYEACEWIDLNGNFWLFGGLHPGADYGDLWKYVPSTNEWTWMKGPGIPHGDAGVYGTQGVPSPLNHPPAIWSGINSWTDLNGNLWLFGGGGSGTGGAYCSDLWKYDIATNEWTWMKGPGFYDYLGNYGMIGVPNISNNPPCRVESAASWTDNNGDLWMFGGVTAPGDSDKNDMWRFNIATNTWTWMKGSRYSNQLGRYGTLGVEDSANTPGTRYVYCRWKDNNGNLWLYGGDSYSDLWRFNVTTNNWTWMGGDSSLYSYDNYGVKCIKSDINKPGGRFENRAAWKDMNENFWMIGGGGHGNDLWVYHTPSKQWMIASQDTSQYLGVWGTKGIPSPTNIPPSTMGSIGWTDYNEHLYLFGGCNGSKWYNALWMFTIDTTCSFFTDVENNSLKQTDFLIYPNPVHNTFTISLNNQSSINNSQLKIFDVTGRVVQEQKINSQLSTFNFQLAAGVYFVKVEAGERVWTEKLVVE